MSGGFYTAYYTLYVPLINGCCDAFQNQPTDTVTDDNDDREHDSIETETSCTEWKL